MSDPLVRGVEPRSRRIVVAFVYIIVIVMFSALVLALLGGVVQEMGADNY